MLFNQNNFQAYLTDVQQYMSITMNFIHPLPLFLLTCVINYLNPQNQRKYKQMFLFLGTWLSYPQFCHSRRNTHSLSSLSRSSQL